MILLSLVLVSVAQTNRLTVSEKLQRIRVPCVEFRDANAIDVADFLMEFTDPNPPFRTSIILNFNTPEGTPAQEQEPDQRRLFYKDLPSVTISLTNATMQEVVENLTKIAGLRFEITTNLVIIKGPDGRDLKKEKWSNRIPVTD